MMDHKVSDEEILESVAERFTAELRAGRQPALREYQSEYPELSEEIHSVLSSIVMIEQLKQSSSGPNLQARLLNEFANLSQIDSYRLLGEIGRGGMGIVFAAEHQSLGRKVAIKVLPIPRVDGEKLVERFSREAQAAAKLHHTNIASVFGVGQGDGFCYYVMDLVEGLCLSDVIAEWRKMPEPKSNDFRWLANLGADLSDALSYAHSNGILHRDIKPSNLILDSQNTLWITDFGLAKDVSSSATLTQTGDVVGTPQYLPPESLDGVYDAQSEVYGVGLILFELATLQPAYSGRSPAELIRAIATRSPEPVRKVNPSIPLDLAIIIDKCLSRDPHHRYATAAALRQDLMAFSQGRSISARRPSLLEAGRRWSRRNPLAAGLAAISTVLLVVAAVTASVGYLKVSQALDKEADVSQSLREQQKATESARLQAEQNLEQLKTQHHRAESNLALSMQAFDEMFKAMVARGVPSSLDVDIDGYRELSGIETAITQQDAEFLDRMVAFYEQFAALNAENDSLRSESARAYRRVGNIYQLVGHFAPAIEAYEKSLRLLPQFDKDPANIKSWLLTKVRTQNELSNTLRRSGALVQSQQTYRQSIEELESSPLCEREPEVRLELARTLAALGFNVMRAMAANPLANADQADRNPAATSGAREDSLERASRLRERNKPLNRQAIEILDELLMSDPKNAEALAVRATCYWNLAAATIDQDRKKGIEYRNLAVEALEALVGSHPENPEYQYLLALACSLVSSQWDDSDLELLKKGIQSTQQLVERHPAVLDYHHLNVNLRAKQAGYLLSKKERDLAHQELRAARSSIETLVSRSTTDRSFSITIGMLMRELQLLGRMYREDGNHRGAVEINQYLNRLKGLRKPDGKSLSK